jgi:non-ribosomal peptide synthetase component F
VAWPEKPVSNLSLLATAEESRLLKDWNLTAVEFPGGCVHQLFEAQAEIVPDRGRLTAEANA